MQEIGRDVLRLKRKLAEGQLTPLREILTDADVKAACHAVGHEHRERLFTPLVTLWGLIGQSLHADPSCRAAVARILTAFGDPKTSGDTSAYCQARGRLPERMIEELVVKMAKRLEKRVAPEQLWLGRRQVRLLDATGIATQDTLDLVRAFGLPPNTKEGVGFPVVHAAGLVSWSTGAVLAAAMGALRYHERHLGRELRTYLDPGDVLVGDSGFGSYAEIAMLMAQEVDSVFRINNTRSVDFRRGQRLGPGDHLVAWKRPAARPEWLPDDIELPETITLREIRFTVEVPGFRPEEIVLVTTLLDAVAFPKEEIAKLFRDRWEIEIDFRHIKVSMGMEPLRGKSSGMARKEIWAHLLAYNLIRTLMWQASRKHRVSALRISFKGTIQRVLAWTSPMAHLPVHRLPDLYLDLLARVAEDIVPFRPNRVEPRCKKRRPKNYPLLTVPRHVARQHLLRESA
jgi:hypothetical protein